MAEKDGWQLVEAGSAVGSAGSAVGSVGSAVGKASSAVGTASAFGYRLPLSYSLWVSSSGFVPATAGNKTLGPNGRKNQLGFPPAGELLGTSRPVPKVQRVQLLSVQGGEAEEEPEDQEGSLVNF